MKRLLAIALAVFYVSGAYAGWANVSCINTQVNSQLRTLVSLVDESGARVTISGQRGRAVLSNGRRFHYFSVAESAYQTINRSCRQTYGGRFKAFVVLKNSLPCLLLINNPYGGVSLSVSGDNHFLRFN